MKPTREHIEAAAPPPRHPRLPPRAGGAIVTNSATTYCRLFDPGHCWVCGAWPATGQFCPRCAYLAWCVLGSDWLCATAAQFELTAAHRDYVASIGVVGQTGGQP